MGLHSLDGGLALRLRDASHEKRAPAGGKVLGNLEADALLRARDEADAAAQVTCERAAR